MCTNFIQYFKVARIFYLLLFSISCGKQRIKPVFKLAAAKIKDEGTKDTHTQKDELEDALHKDGKVVLKAKKGNQLSIKFIIDEGHAEEIYDVKVEGESDSNLTIKTPKQSKKLKSKDTYSMTINPSDTAVSTPRKIKVICTDTKNKKIRDQVFEFEVTTVT